MTQFDHDSVVPFGDSGLTKKEQVAEMFDSIAHKYDFLNRFLSAGIDIRWRKKALNQLKGIKTARILDVATGTADFAIMASGILKPEKVIGIDISKGMLDLGKKKIEKSGLTGVIELLEGDSENIAFSDNSFDAVTVAFGVRNFQNLEKGLTEIKRVLRPGGKLVVLEFSRPRYIPVKWIYAAYMKIVAPNVGKIFSKNKEAYIYLDASIQKFPERGNFVKVLNSVGYTDTFYKPLSLGICSIYCGKK